MLAEPEGYVRLFVGEGEPMRALLRHAAAAGVAPAYTRRLLAAFDLPPQPVSTQIKPASPPSRPTSTPARPAAPALAEPLTAREVEVLRLIAAGMRNDEIANHLFISPSTVKRHIANAYGKLGATHRIEAVTRANDLHLLWATLPIAKSPSSIG